MTLHAYLERRLKAGGWTQIRQGRRHELWGHPNGAVFTLSVNARNIGRKQTNYLKEIQQKERQ